MNVTQRFLSYVKVHTMSDDASTSSPSAARELDLARQLQAELLALGVTDAELTETGYVYGHLPATPGCEKAPALGFVAHMDTATAFSGESVTPILHENYDGKDLALPREGRVLKVSEFPTLALQRGRTLITADGSTLLGADDKAGIAEIMTMCEELLQSGRPHGRVCIAFTPDEEVGRGTEHFDVERFGADFAYTVDGGEAGSIDYENFNAASAEFAITGVAVHPGSAKGVMVNALLLACEINAMLPPRETPAHTEGYEGFFHLDAIQGDGACARMNYIVRDHDRGRFEERKQLLAKIADTVQAKYPTAQVRLALQDTYYNMAQQLAPCMHLIKNARAACELAGVNPVTEPIRGGTDGANLSFMGVPCPNLGTGGHNAHGPYEYVTVEGMETCVAILHHLVDLYAKTKRGEL